MPTQTAFSGQIEPRARRLASEAGVDLNQIRGTGPQGRITEADVRQHIDAGNSGAPAQSPGDAAGIPLKGLRGTIARKMLQSLQNSAQLTLVSDADVTAFEERRRALKAQLPLSFTEMLVPAVAAALRQHPQLNALLENDVLTPQPGVHIGIAVQTDAGLVVPVLHDADTMRAGDVRERFRNLVDAVRQGTAAPADMTGGSFTITNLGAYGIDSFTPILHTPQVAILGVGRSVERYVRVDGTAQWRSFASLSLTFDHRAVDGAPAAAFLQTLAGLLATPENWLRT